MNLLLSICLASSLVAQTSTERPPDAGADELQPPSNEDAIHAQLRGLRDALFEAYEGKDLDGMAAFLHQDAVITWQNGQRNRGPDGFRRFYVEMMEGEDKIVESISSEVTINDLSVLHGEDTAVAFGEIDDQYHLASGQKFNLHSWFTATLVKEEDHWLIASFHISANLFDNPLLSAMQKLLYYVGGIVAVAGLVMGLILGVRLGRRKNSLPRAASSSDA